YYVPEDTQGNGKQTEKLPFQTGGAGSIAGGMLAKAQGERILKGATSGGLKGLAQHIPGAKTYNAIMEKGKTATGGKAKDAVASVE
ncbi:hypothetical protein, partial [Helicobacter ganmani]|uniref:hypothetical protein n=1 Tax=Helicobacter ganmani TaxID=60246 RepID=UPI003A83E8D2